MPFCFKNFSTTLASASTKISPSISIVGTNCCPDFFTISSRYSLFFAISLSSNSILFFRKKSFTSTHQAQKFLEYTITFITHSVYHLINYCANLCFFLIISSVERYFLIAFGVNPKIGQGILYKKDGIHSLIPALRGST